MVHAKFFGEIAVGVFIGQISEGVRFWHARQMPPKPKISLVHRQGRECD